jgi:hypothetical protein
MLVETYLYFLGLEERYTMNAPKLFGVYYAVSHVLVCDCRAYVDNM